MTGLFDQSVHIEQREARWREFLTHELAAGTSFEFVGWFLTKRHDQPMTLFAGFVRSRHRTGARAPWWFAGRIGETSEGPEPWRDRGRGRSAAIRGPLSILSSFAVKPEARALLELQARAMELTRASRTRLSQLGRST